MKKSLLFVAICLLVLASSCKKEEKEPAYGLTSLSMVTATGQSYTFAIDQETLIADNTADPVPIFTQDAELKNCTLNIAVTLDALVSVNGTEVTTGKVENLDMTSPITVVVTMGKWSKTYTVKLVKAEVSADMAKGVKMIADFRNGGVANNLTDFDVVYKDGSFYMYTTTFNSEDSTALYQVYKSMNGTNWELVGTTPASVGAVGARAAVVNGSSFLVGGCRPWGKDEDGNDPESALTWGMLGYTVKELKVWETTDFVNFTNHTKDVVFDVEDGSMLPMLFERMAPVNYNQVTEFGGKIWWHAGFYVAYGSMQGGMASLLSSSDGITWKESVPDIQGSYISQSSFFSFKNKLWMVGGFANFLAAETNMLSSVYSSSNGSNWTLETPSEDALAISSATVVVNKSGTTAYLFGGDLLIDSDGDGARELLTNKDVYKSTDGINWTKIEVNADYSGRRSPAVVVDDNNIAWVYGRANATLGNYGYSTDAGETMGNLLYDVWAFALDE